MKEQQDLKNYPLTLNKIVSIAQEYRQASADEISKTIQGKRRKRALQNESYIDESDSEYSDYRGPAKKKFKKMPKTPKRSKSFKDKVSNGYKNLKNKFRKNSGNGKNSKNSHSEGSKSYSSGRRRR